MSCYVKMFWITSAITVWRISHEFTFGINVWYFILYGEFNKIHLGKIIYKYKNHQNSSFIFIFFFLLTNAEISLSNVDLSETRKS